MKLKVLVDNNTYIDEYYCGEPAVSYYIEDEGNCLLLDVGYSDLFLKNLNAFNINLEKITTIAISHGHDDHTRGLRYLFDKSNKNISIVAHPHAFKEKRINNKKVCSPILEKKLKDLCTLKLSKNPIQISKNITFLGEIPQLNNFENRKIMGKQLLNNNFVEDFVMDDTALVYKGRNGIYIITGCSHSGICNIIEYAKTIFNDTRILGVIGGFHLLEVDDQVNKTIDYLFQNNITELYPCHCTSFGVKSKIHEVIPIKEVGVGLEIDWV